jgi:hypothetical protein
MIIGGNDQPLDDSSSAWKVWIKEMSATTTLG